jgi:hypothetical protein
MTKTFLALLLAFWSMAASAQVITFDDLTDYGSGSWISNGYAGLNWDNFGVLNAPAYSTNSGYQNGVVSGTNVAFNSGGNQAITSSGSTFTFESAYFAAAWNDGLAVLVQGYNGASLIDSISFLVNTSGPLLQTFNWNGIDKVVFSSSGGTKNINFDANYGGTMFAMDNMTISPVPEPETYAMLLVGLGLIGFMARRRKEDFNF